MSADEEMVGDPDTTWPVLIDPPLSGVTRHEWVQVRSSGSSKYKPTSTEGVGFCDVSSWSSCARDFKARMVWEYTGMSAPSKIAAGPTAGIQWSTRHTGTAYNLTVGGLATYYVLAGNTPVLVHNVGLCKEAPKEGSRVSLISKVLILKTRWLPSRITGSPVRSRSHRRVAE